MHQQINKKKIYFYIFSFLLLTTLINEKYITEFSASFLLKNIIINTDTFEAKRKIKLKTDYLINSNIFLLNSRKIKNEINNFNFLENLKVKKKFPSTIIINAKNTDLLAITYLDKNKYFVGNNEKFILSKDISTTKKLPIIFGKFEIIDYINLKKKLKDHNLKIDNFTKYYFHKNKRWDLYHKDNILIKLPNKNLTKALGLYNNFKKQYDIKPNTIIDLRIENRIVLKHD